MRKISILIAYIVAFWVLIPALILVGSSRLDLMWGWGSSPHPVSGIILLLFTAPLLFITIGQYLKFSGELPVSAYPPKNILRRGVYNYWRHPIYLFYIGTFFGIALLLGSLSMLLLVLPLFTLLTWFYSHMEEKQLVERFGKAYLYYKKRTGLVFPDFYQSIRFPGLLLMKFLYHYKVRHKERIPLSPPYFVVAEHKNYSDPLLIGLAFSHPISFLTTYEMYRSPRMIGLMELMCNIPRKRFKPDFTSNKRMLEALEVGAVIGIFPEGERSWTGETQAFKPEVLKSMLKKNEVPIVPVKLEGNYAAWPRWAKGFRRYQVTVEIKESMYAHPGMSVEELEDRIRKSLGDSDTPKIIARKIPGLVDGLEKVFYRCSACHSFNTFSTSEDKLCCQKCGFSLRIAEDLSVSVPENESHRRLSIADYYRSIRVTADDTLFQASEINSKSGGYWVDLQELGKCDLSIERGIRFEPLLSGYLRLTQDNMDCRNHEQSSILPFSDIRSITTESNNKLQLYLTGGELYQLQFEKASVLQWQDILISAIYLKTGRYVNRR